MSVKVLIITNNPMVHEKFPDACFLDGSLKDVLIKTRDYIHKGYVLLSHPMAGSIKPNETPYRTVVLNDKPAVQDMSLDFKSLEIIENAIMTVDKFLPLNKYKRPEVLKDFQLVDLSLLVCALDSLQMF
ncbi:MAG: GrdX family protein [Bacillota bacterium]